jgi:carbon-monoxide dehydrogenase small subunit
VDEAVTISLLVNGLPIRRSVSPRMNLVDFLRTDLGLTGSHIGCEHGVCGACTVVLDGRVVRGCLLFAVQAQGKEVETIEGATESQRLRKLQDAFEDRNALQCGFCTPGILLTAAELIARREPLTREDIRQGLSGNLCRCTGYHAIVDAIEAVAAKSGAVASDTQAGQA